MKKSLFRNTGYVISLVLFSIAIAVLHHELRHYHLRDIAREMRSIRPLFLAGAVLLTILDYFTMTFYDTLALRYLRQRLPYSQVATASFIGYVFTHNMTILGGSAARYRIYSALGISAGEVARLVVFCGLTFWLGFFTITGTVFIVESQAVPQDLHIPLVNTTWPIGVIFLAVVAAYLFMIALRRRPMTFREWEFEIPSMPISVGQILIASTDWLLAAGVLYTLLPAATGLTFGRFIAIFMLAQMIGLISAVPGGVGVFETVVLLLLSPYAERSAIIGSLVIYRVIYYLLPFVPAAPALVIYEMALERHRLKRLGAAFGEVFNAIVPHMLAGAAFIAGALLLFSGALPAAPGRIKWLGARLPLPALEISHFLASIAGAALLIVGRALQRRINAAWHLAIGLLLAGVVLSVLKGLDYEQAIILTVMLVLFLPCRSQFYRKASLLSEKFTPGWIVMTGLVIICSIWLGMFAYKHVEYSNDLWWRFAINSDAPRFLRATCGAVVLLLLYSVVRLLGPARKHTHSVDVDTASTVEMIVRNSPKTYAHLALLGDKSILLNDQRDAFIMYGVQGRSWIAMGDPVGPQQQWDSLLWTFRELCDRRDAWPVFYQISADRFDLYIDLGLTFLKLGEEAVVNLAEFTLDGPSRKSLRYSRSRCARENCEFSVIPPEGVDAVIDNLAAVSNTWLSQKNTAEKGFSLGFFDPAYIRKLPVAVVRRENEIIAFANLWTGADNYELSLDLMRYLPSAPAEIMEYLFVETMLWGQQQGYQHLSLGMAPMSGLENRALAPLWQKAGSFLFRYGEHFYNFKGLRQYKQKFDPQWKPKYIACPRGLMLPRILTNIATIISGGLKNIVAR